MLGLDQGSVLRLQNMVRVGLVSAEELRSWADRQLERTESPPIWLCDLAMARDPGEVLLAIAAGIRDAPLLASSPDVARNYLACLLVLHAQGTLPWAQFLKTAGDFCDARNTTDPSCEHFFLQLTALEHAAAVHQVEESQRMALERLLALDVAVLNQDASQLRPPVA